MGSSNVPGPPPKASWYCLRLTNDGEETQTFIRISRCHRRRQSPPRPQGRPQAGLRSHPKPRAKPPCSPTTSAGTCARRLSARDGVAILEEPNKARHLQDFRKRLERRIRRAHGKTAARLLKAAKGEPLIPKSSTPTAPTATMSPRRKSSSAREMPIGKNPKAWVMLSRRARRLLRPQKR